MTTVTACLRWISLADETAGIEHPLTPLAEAAVHAETHQQRPLHHQPEGTVEGVVGEIPTRIAGCTRQWALSRRCLIQAREGTRPGHRVNSASATIRTAGTSGT